MKLRLGWLLILVALGLNACSGSWGAATVAAQSQAAGGKSDDISGAWILIELFPDETHTHRMMQFFRSNDEALIDELGMAGK